MFDIDPRSGAAPYEQLRVQLADAMRDGRLAVGAKLPTVRRLADDLGLAAGTVARAYRELEADDLIETRGRHGSFVAAHGDAQQRQAQLAAHDFAERMRHLAVDPDTAIDLAARALRMPAEGE